VFEPPKRLNNARTKRNKTTQKAILRAFPKETSPKIRQRQPNQRPLA
jgi:hypothetical protein